MSLDSKTLALFYSQLGTIIEAGVPIQNALRSLSRTSPSSIRKALSELQETIQRGEPLHQAIALQPYQFPSLDHSILAISEKSGGLDVGLFSLANYYEKRATARSKISSATLLPAILFVTAVFIAPLPRLILGILGQNDYSLSHYLFDTVGLLTLLIVVGFLSFRLLRFLFQVPHLNITMERITNLIPVFGRFHFDFVLSQWVQSLRLMLKAGYGIVDALNSSIPLSNSPLLAWACQRAIPLVNSQMDVSRVLQSTGVFPPMLIQLWATGEQSGRMDEMFEKLTQHYEETWQRSLEHLSTWIPRVIYALVSLFIIFQIFKLAGVYIHTLNAVMEPL